MTIVALLIAALVMVAVVAGRLFWRLRRANDAAAAFEDSFWSGGSLDALHQAEGIKPAHPMGAVFEVGMSERRRNAGALAARAMMRVTIRREMERFDGDVLFLGCVVVVAPALGLFYLFVTMAAASVTASGPGLTRGLLALVAGLVVSLLAGLALIVAAALLGRFRARLHAFATEFSVILARGSW